MLNFKVVFIAILSIIILSSKLWAYDFGPFSLKGFALVQLNWGINQCVDCQRYPEENRQRLWADEIIAGKEYKPGSSVFSLFQPYFELRPIYLGKGFKISALISQRWRDLKVDIPGVMYEQNIRLEQEYYGSIQLGAFPTRGWGVADYPYGSSVGLSDPWGASGSGYGLLSNAIRYTGPLIYFLGGDLILEITFDKGDNRFKTQSSFTELYGKYVGDQLFFDFIYQKAINGVPTSWTHSPFLGIVDDPKYDNGDLPGNLQTMLLIMGKVSTDYKVDILGGMRRNYWSGADAVTVGVNDEGQYLWNNMFNVHWNGTLNGVQNPGYPAISYDYMLGAVYNYSTDLVFSSGMIYLGETDTENPLERGQSNSLLMNSFGAGYKGFSEDVTVSLGINVVNFKNKGLAPLSMPSHSYSGIDSRIVKSGFSSGLEVIYQF